MRQPYSCHVCRRHRTQRHRNRGKMGESTRKSQAGKGGDRAGGLYGLLCGLRIIFPNDKFMKPTYTYYWCIWTHFYLILYLQFFFLWLPFLPLPLSSDGLTKLPLYSTDKKESTPSGAEFCLPHFLAIRPWVSLFSVPLAAYLREMVTRSSPVMAGALQLWLAHSKPSKRVCYSSADLRTMCWLHFYSFNIYILLIFKHTFFK